MRALEGVFLVGPMGAGKSTIGRYLAECLEREFCDCDHEIEQRTGASVGLIFAVEGEAGFRRWEAAVLAELAVRPNLVLATGGGAILAPANRALLKAHGKTVYLHADCATLWGRVRKDRNRPLLQTDDPRARIETLYHEREPLYREAADLIVDTQRRSPQSVARLIACGLRKLARVDDDA
ncbi:MAG TPA: shikimate kinase [Acidiferrobacter sp.]|nr:shikimate kinase [Acidiferrobacter sp.]